MTTIEDLRRVAAISGEAALVMALPSKRESDILARLTAILSRCDDLDAMLARREFSGAEIDDLKDAACVRASEMSQNAPFEVLS